MASGRIIHTPEEITRIRRAAAVTACVRDDIARMARPGMSTFELDQLAGELINRTGGIVPSSLEIVERALKLLEEVK